MTRDIAELQHGAIAGVYTHDFGSDYRLLKGLNTSDLRLIDSTSADGGTDPGDDVTIYLIEGRGEKGYLMLSDGFHVDLKKAAWIGALVARPDVCLWPLANMIARVNLQLRYVRF